MDIVKARLGWIQLYEETNDAGLVCRRCGISRPTLRKWQRRFQGHLAQYGHTIYDLDFAKPVPVDAPAPLLETLKFFISGAGANPYTRQQTTAEQREQATQTILQRLKGPRLALFRRLVRWAQKYAPLREDGLADVGLGWPLVRQMLLELGRRFTLARAVAQADDRFWLTQGEVEQTAAALDRGHEFVRRTRPVSEPLAGARRDDAVVTGRPFARTRAGSHSATPRVLHLGALPAGPRRARRARRTFIRFP